MTAQIQNGSHEKAANHINIMITLDAMLICSIKNLIISFSWGTVDEQQDLNSPIVSHLDDLGKDTIP